MEISDYLKAARRRMWLLVGLPVLGALLAVGMVLIQPTQYRAVVTVGAPALVGNQGGQYSGTGGVSSFVANFTAAATSPVVAQEVATKTGATKDDVTNGVRVKQIGASSLLTVAYTSTNQALSTKVATEAAAASLQYLFSTQVQLATAQLTQAQAQLTAATKAFEDYSAANGVLMNQTYSNLQQQIASLTQTAIELDARGDSSAAAAARAAAASAQAQANGLAPKLTTYTALSDAKDTAAGNVQTAQQALTAASTQQAAADPTKTVTLTRTATSSATGSLAKAVLVGLGGGLFIAAALILALELIDRRRRNNQPTSPTSPTSNPTHTDTHAGARTS